MKAECYTLPFKAAVLIAVLVAPGCFSVSRDLGTSRLEVGRPPFAVEGLPIRILSARIEHRSLFIDPTTGDHHLMLVYVTGGPLQLLDFNLAKGSTRSLDGVEGRPGPQAAVLHPNGRFYLASSDPGFLMEYNLSSGKTRQIRRLSDKGAQWMDVGDDGALYIGEMAAGRVERYDPASESWEDFGIMDDPGPPYYRYAYTLGSDGRFVYAGMGQDPWYLVIYDRQTHKTETLWKSLKGGAVTISKGLHGGWFVQVAGVGWFKLEGGKVLQVAAPEVVPTHLRGGICSDETLSRCGGEYDIDLGRAVPVAAAGGTGIAEIRYRIAGAPEWQSLKTPVRVVPQSIKQLVAGEDDTLLGITGFYGPIFKFSLTKDAGISLLGATLRSTYDALYLPDRGEWYLAGYPAATLINDPKREWSLLPGATPSDKSLNPHAADVGFGKYHYYLARGADGFVYVGAQHERDSTGGDLGWYDPDAGLSGHLREPFVRFNVRDLKPVLGGRLLVYSSSSIAGAGGNRADAAVFVFDVASKKIVREIVPLPGVPDLDKIVETAPGVVVGVAGSECFSLDVQSGKVLYRKNLGARFGTTAPYDRRLVLGPDGYVWLVLMPPEKDELPQIARLDPANGRVEVVLGVPGLVNFLIVHGSTEGEYDALLYGRNELKRVRAILVQDSQPMQDRTSVTR